MLYCSWDMACDECYYYSFWAIFCPFTPLTAQKIKNLKKKKKMKKFPGDIIILHKYTKCHDHMLYCSWDMVRDTWNYYFSFWAIFWNQNLKKMKKMHGDIIILHMCTINYDQMNVWFLRYSVSQMDGRTDRKSYIQSWVAHLKNTKMYPGLSQKKKKTLWPLFMDGIKLPQG